MLNGDSEEIVSGSLFEPVWSVLKALRSHDDVLAEEIDELRLRRALGGGKRRKLRLPKKIRFDLPRAIDFEAFQKALTTQVLDRIGSPWDLRFFALEAFRKRHGHCDVPARYKKNPELGTWVGNQRTLRSRGKLSDERIQRLDAIGFPWDAHDLLWERRFQELVEYERKHGHCNVPSRYRKNLKLGNWANNQRGRRGELSDERIQRLDAIGFPWDVYDALWEQRFEELVEYERKHGHCNVPRNYAKSPKLSSWVSNQRSARSRGELSDERIRRLKAIGFVWDARGAP